MSEPIAYFLTWSTYGTWLPGDRRGWVEYHQGWQLPDPILELECAARMSENACRLSSEQRAAVQQQIAETCQHRGWHLHAVNCRSNHLHVVVTASGVKPLKVRVDLKAWTTRCLKQQFDRGRENWWTEKAVSVTFTTRARSNWPSFTQRKLKTGRRRNRMQSPLTSHKCRCVSLEAALLHSHCPINPEFYIARRVSEGIPSSRVFSLAHPLG